MYPNARLLRHTIFITQACERGGLVLKPSEIILRKESIFLNSHIRKSHCSLLLFILNVDRDIVFFPGTSHYLPRVASSSSSGVRAGAWNPSEGNTPSVVSTLYPSNEGSLPPPWRGAVTFDDCGCSECSTIVSPFQGTRRTAHATRVTKGLESSEYQAELFFQAQHFTAKHEKRAEKWTPWRRKSRYPGMLASRTSEYPISYNFTWVHGNQDPICTHTPIYTPICTHRIRS